MKTLAAGLLMSTVVLVGTISAAAAHHYDVPQYPMPAPDHGPPPGPVYNFYGPTTNYFGAPPDDQGPPAGYDGPPAYYGEAPPPYDWRQLPPQQYYEDGRLDPWSGYDGNRGLENGY